MFLGEFQHSLDAKGRVILPARFRDQLTEGGFVTKGRGGCLSVYTPEEFENVASLVREQSKRGPELNAARTFFSGASEINPTSRAGWRSRPTSARSPASAEVVVVAGVFSRIEIWDRERWLEHDRVGARALAESDDLPDFGI